MLEPDMMAGSSTGNPFLKLSACEDSCALLRFIPCFPLQRSTLSDACLGRRA